MLRTYAGNDNMGSLRKTFGEREVLVRAQDDFHAKLRLERLCFDVGAHERSDLECVRSGVPDKTREHCASDVS